MENAKNLAIEYYAIAGKNVKVSVHSFKPVKWEAPPIHWYKLNTDGSSIGNPGKAGAGAIIRNDKGQWVQGSYRFIGYANNMMAELWALRDGLIMAKNLNLDNLIVEVDATAVIACISSTTIDNEFLKPLILDCRTLLNGFRNLLFKHVYREGNQCADALARKGSSWNINISSLFQSSFKNIMVVDIMPDFMAPFVNADVVGLPMYRTFN